MKEECLICKAPLEYLQSDKLMECMMCGKQEPSKTQCIFGHYVCDECHSKGVDAIVGLCLRETSTDPISILDKMMAMPFCHMHGTEHHIMVGSALLTAYHNAGGKLDLESALTEMQNRGKQLPGGTCGFWGACGAGISAGIFVAIATNSTPLSVEPFSLSNRMTSKALEKIGIIGGPRCCKRDSYLAIQAAVEFTREELGVQMDTHDVTCEFAHMNNQCIGKRCPFSKVNRV